MLPFIGAAELKKEFNVFGHFYSVRLKSKEVVECRSVLEIVANARKLKNHTKLSTLRPDAVFIMMNPGSSSPLDEVSNCIPISALHKMPISLVPAKPDKTQYQAMRLMLSLIHI